MIPSRPLALVLAALAMPACHSTCGTYTSCCDLGDLARDDWVELCKTDRGTTGDMGFDEGTAILRFGPEHRDEEVDALASDLQLYVLFVREEVVSGLELELISGGAGVVGEEEVPLTQGSITVVEHGPPRCRGIPQQDVRLDWSLEWGEPEGEHYTAEALDWVRFDLEDDHEVCE